VVRLEQEKIGKFIKEIRVKNKLTQKEFADKFGVTYQAVSKWENGKNLPDINILKDICKEYSVSVDELLLGDDLNAKKNTKWIFIGVISVVVIIIGLIVLYFINIHKVNHDFEFKKLSSMCDNFKVVGSMAYNDLKSSIYISHVDYRGDDDGKLYKKLECVFYEVDTDIKKEISRYNYNGKEGITLEEFLSDVTFNIDNYEKVCKKYQENSFLLEVDVTLENGDVSSYKIPLKLEDNCST
jgi:transcriptional regulator with XRE-family HTH domain